MATTTGGTIRSILTTGFATPYPNVDVSVTNVKNKAIPNKFPYVTIQEGISEVYSTTRSGSGVMRTEEQVQVDIWQNIATNSDSRITAAEDYALVPTVMNLLNNANHSTLGANGHAFRFLPQSRRRLFEDLGADTQIIHDAITVAVARQY